MLHKVFKRRCASVIHTSALILAFAVTISSASCGIASKETKELGQLSDNMLSEYSAQFDYAVSVAGEQASEGISGSAIVSRSGGKVSLSILSPSPYGGICAAYTASALPDSIEIAYEGINLEMPKSAFDKINTAMAVFTDDFALTLRTQPKEFVKDSSESELRTVNFSYNGSDVSVRYASEECLPVSFTIVRDGIVINAAAVKMKLENQGAE